MGISSWVYRRLGPTSGGIKSMVSGNIANEALELIAEWLTSRFLQLTVRKCEANLVTR